MKQIYYLAVSYDELTEKAKTNALKQAKKKYGEILADDVKLTELLRKQRTTFDINGNLSDLIGLHQFFVTGEPKEISSGDWSELK